jgi:MoaA/NifB/PqqE/SkfB family radical SAM enzyme
MSTTTMPPRVENEHHDGVSGLSFLWLELTGRCQLSCVHCYASSGPTGTHGSMRAVDWRRVIDEAAGLGARMVQFIGGEPTLHPALPELVDHALSLGIDVEVFSNLVHATPGLWETFSRPGVRLACSYYSDDPAQHAAVTGSAGSHARTRANIGEALRRSIRIRVGVVDLGDEQRADRAVNELRALGVTEVGYDRLRQVGRGIRDQVPNMDQLCGNCASGVLAISPNGDVWPCVFSRWLPVGNVRMTSLPAIVAGQQITSVRQELTTVFAGRQAPCVPNMCDPQCGPSCSPACQPQNNCVPVGACAPDYR